MEVQSESRPVPIYRIGVRDRFVECGGINELFTLHQMQPGHIAEAARKVMQVKKS